MPKYYLTIEATYEVELPELSTALRERITNDYENPTLPDYIPEEAVEYLGGRITYEVA